MSHLLLLLTLAADPVPADVVIRNATIHDGSGKAGYVGDVAIAGDKIVGVGKVAVAGSPRIIDGTGLVVAPGFIDLHTHCDSGDNPITRAPGRSNQCYLMQGVTTVVTGNCGSGPVDVKAFYATLEKERRRHERRPPGPAQQRPLGRSWGTPTEPRRPTN